VKGRPKNIVASIHQRLHNKAQETDRPFGEILQYFAIERFLYRLSVSRHADSFVLKGALMLPIWSRALSRPTVGIDLLGRTANRVEAIADVVGEVCGVEVEPDGLTFDAASIEAEPISPQAEYEGVRVRFRGALDNARISMQIDVGFGDVVVPSAQHIRYPALLDLPAPQLEAYSKESVIAEKLQAMVRLGELNSRMKDFYDVWAMARQLDFDGAGLAEAIKATFDNRATALPADPEPFRATFAENPVKQAQWRGFIRRHRLEGDQARFEEVIADLASFLVPVTRGVATQGTFEGAWRAPGPWAGST